MKNKLLIKYRESEKPSDNKRRKKIPYWGIAKMYMNENANSNSTILNPIDLKEFVKQKMVELELESRKVENVISRVESLIKARGGFKIPIDNERYGYVRKREWDWQKDAQRNTILTTIGLLDLLFERSTNDFLPVIKMDTLVFYPIPHPHLKYGDIILSHGYLIPLVSNHKLIEPLLRHINNIITEKLCITEEVLNRYIQNVIHNQK